MPLDDPRRSHAPLHRAADGDDSWPGDDRAHAAMAATLLRLGRTEEGLEGLRAAADRFEERGDYEGVMRSLSNAAACQRLTGDAPAATRNEMRVAASARERAIVLER